MRYLAVLAVALCWLDTVLAAEPAVECPAGNRLVYLDDFCDPYTFGLSSPRLITPQWVGEPGVEAVVTLGIDDMRLATPQQLTKLAAGKLTADEIGDPARYERYLRPVLDRLKKIDGRAPVSIMCNQVDPQDAQLQSWLKEGLSLETHTADHPCPCLRQTGFDHALSTFNRCVDQLAQVPGSKPVAFRFPCCDSQNTPSPRAFVEILSRTTPAGNFIQIDTSVAVILNDADPSLARSIVRDDQNRPRFARYVPFPNFVNRVFNYPYPFVVAGRIWEFPIGTPDDWQGFNLQQAGNPATLADMQKYLDAVVQKRGVHNLTFHPWGWIRGEQVAALVDYADRTYGRKVKFLTFKECLQRLNEHLLAGQPVRAADGGDNGVRILDLNRDGYMDVLIGNDQLQRTRVWDPKNTRWIDGELPLKLVSGTGKTRRTNQVRFGVLDQSGLPVMLVRDGQTVGSWRFDGTKWVADASLLAGLEENGTPVNTGAAGKDLGVRMRDLDDDGICELIVANPTTMACFRWDGEHHTWRRLPFALPDGVYLADANGLDGGTRFADFDDDGLTDVMDSCERGTGVFLMDTMNTGWTRTVLAAAPGSPKALPMFSNAGVNGGGWFADRQVWFQNESTAELPDGVLHRSFNEIVQQEEPRPLSPKQALKTMHVTPGFRVELVAAEPLVMDPVNFDWGPDGKLWVVEMADYPTGMDGKGKPGGRVRFLEDTNGDGQYDQSTLFADGLNFPNGVMAWRDGVLISAAPQVIFARDTNGDGKCDEQTVLFDGFGEGNQQHRANGFKWSMDGSVHMANGDSNGRIRSVKTGKVVDLAGRDLRIWPDDGRMEPVTGITQFGRERDDWEHWFGTNNASPFYQFVLEERYLRRNPHVAPPGTRATVADPLTTLSPLSRMLERFNVPESAYHFTSACGGMIYRDHILGDDVEGNLFVCEPVHNLVHREQVRRQGLTFHGVRAPDEQTSHFLRSTDNWFRPVTARTGPDGAIWIADMYRIILEHPEWIPDNQEAKIDVRAGHDRGRIYRVVSVRHPARKIRRLDPLATAELVAALDSPGGTERDRVQELLYWRNDKAAIEPLRKLAAQAGRPIVRAQALWTLSLLDDLEDVQLLAALADQDPRVQAQAVRMAEPRLNRQPRLGEALLKLIDVEHPDVQLQLAYTLGAWDDPRAADALGTLLARHANDQFLAAAALSSVHTRNLAGVLSKVLTANPPAGAVLARLFAVAATIGDNRVLRHAVEQVAKSADGNYTDTQLRAISAVLTELERRKLALADALGNEVLASLKPAFAAARRYVADPDQRESLRTTAIQMLALNVEPADAELLAERFSPQESGSVQQAAIAALLQMGATEEAESLFAAWDSFSPAIRAFALEELLTRENWTLALLDRLESKAIGPNQLSAAHRQQLANSKSAAVRDRAAKLFAAGTGSRAEVVARFQAVCSLRGDKQRGREVFLKRCATCHRLEGQGHQVGADLTTLVNRAPDYLLIAILDPNRAVEDKFVNYIVALDDGRQLSGVLASESGESLTLRAQEGKDHVVLRKEIDALKNTGKSYMPEGLEADMNEQDLADVIAYLGGFGPPPKQFAGNEPRTVTPDADGSFTLPASAARIYGTTAVFESAHQNIGWWSSPDDSASWTISIPREGTFKVLLDFACATNNAGSSYALDLGGETLTATTHGTGSWDNYQEVELGTVSIPAGEHTINFRSTNLLPGKCLLDLRTIKLVPVK